MRDTLNIEQIRPLSIPKTFTIPGPPAPAVRLSREDKWIGAAHYRPKNQREASRREILRRYFDWCMTARLAAGWDNQKVLLVPTQIIIRAYFPIPKSKKLTPGAVHTVKPVTDNLCKALKDAIFANDQMVWSDHTEKFWDDGKGPRMEVELLS
jgi:Holliday junction resolvase RusA-like endonuclease